MSLSQRSFVRLLILIPFHYRLRLDEQVASYYEEQFVEYCRYTHMAVTGFLRHLYSHQGGPQAEVLGTEEV